MIEATNNDQLAQIFAEHQHRDGPLLPILHEVQAAFGFISEDTIRAIAQALNLTRAEVHGVVSFYHDFKTEAVSRQKVQLCRAEACKARGVEALVAALPESAKEKIEPVYCLGLCSVGPNAMFAGMPAARLDTEKLLALIESVS